MATSTELKNSKKLIQNERDLLLARKRAIENIIASIDSKFTGVISDINYNSNSCEVDLRAGLRCDDISRPKYVIEDINNERESLANKDKHISASKENLQDESKRLENKINQLNDSITDLNGQIKTAQTKELEEKINEVRDFFGV